MAYQIINNDVIKWAAEYDGPKFHAALLDPPYHLTSITKRFGKEGSKPAKGGVYNRAAKGFMGSTWDGGDLIFRPETWGALTQHLYPGAFGMAFASSRGWHRMAVAIEDSGLIIHPSVFMLGWTYLSGFPKATRVKGDKRFDKHRYGGQALKPALEPIIVFQKPYDQRPVDNITQTGAGSLNIDKSRIPAESGLAKNWERNQSQSAKEGRNSMNGGLDTIDLRSYTPSGRWPANFLLQCSCDPLRPDQSQHDESCPVAMLDRQSGESVSQRSMRGEQSDMRGDNYNRANGAKLPDSNSERGYNDSGPASRMFHRADWNYETLERLENANPIHYQPKPSSTERDAGLADLETKTRHRVNAGGLENEPRFAPTQVKNHHPTLKSISLTKYLAGLLLPPAEYTSRRLLTPFSGVGSEMIGAILAGWDDVTGIEQSAEYVRIANKRLEWWSKWPGWGQTDVDKILASLSNEDTRQGRLF